MFRGSKAWATDMFASRSIFGGLGMGGGGGERGVGKVVL